MSFWSFSLSFVLGEDRFSIYSWRLCLFWYNYPQLWFYVFGSVWLTISFTADMQPRRDIKLRNLYLWLWAIADILAGVLTRWRGHLRAMMLDRIDWYWLEMRSMFLLQTKMTFFLESGSWGTFRRYFREGCMRDRLQSRISMQEIGVCVKKFLKFYKISIKDWKKYESKQ